MNPKGTEELEKIPGPTHIDNIGGYLSENADSRLSSDRPFQIT